MQILMTGLSIIVKLMKTWLANIVRLIIPVTDYMDFCRTTFHIVQQGDTFYRLAQQYRTTVPDIIQRNPGINPYNLQVGGKLYICSGVGQNDMQEEELKLNNEMRESWLQHIYWELMFQSAFLNDLPGKSAVEERLLQTAEDIASVFAPFYSENKISALTDLLEEHIEIAGRILEAMKDGDIAEEEKQDALFGNLQRRDSAERELAQYQEVERLLIERKGDYENL